jgi:hypothetical protein
MQKNVRSLWRAVIMQACIDATSQSRKKRAISHKKKAREWLDKAEAEHFIDTCGLAEMEPKYVQMKVKNFFKKKEV